MRAEYRERPIERRCVMIGELAKMARNIDGMIYDVVADESITPGQALTVLRWIEKTLTKEIAACEYTVRRRTRMKRKAKGGE